MSKSKTGVLAHVGASDKTLALDAAEIARRIETTEADLDAARREHRRAALDVETKLPGSAQRVIAALDAVRKADERLVTLRAALVEAEEREAENARATEYEGAERQDKAAQKAFDRLADVGVKFEAALSLAASLYGDLVRADLAARSAAVEVQGRLRRGLYASHNIGDFVEREFARLAMKLGVPSLPGARRSFMSNPDNNTPLGQRFADLARAASDDLAEARAKRVA